MKVNQVLCDAAVGHQDGTFSLIRGGITELNVAKGAPLLFNGGLIIRVVSDSGDLEGDHDIAFRCIGTNGEMVAAGPANKFRLGNIPAVVNSVINMQLIFPRPGKYEFVAVLDGKQVETWPLEVKYLEVKATS